MKQTIWFLGFLAIIATANSCSSSCNDCCNNCQSQCTTSQCVSSCQQNCCQQQQCCQHQQCCQQQKCTKSCTSEKKCPEICPEPVKTINGSRRIEQDDTDNVEVNVQSANIVNNNNQIQLAVNVDSNVVNNIDNEVASVNPPPPTFTPPPITPPPWQPPPPQPRCCVIVRPCLSMGCRSHHYSCSGCQGGYGYWPVNPCYPTGCRKKMVWERQRCTMNQCMTRNVDCSHCSEDFYQSYASYSRCHGCFESLG